MFTSLSGWHSRAEPYSQHFIPDQSALRLAVLRNTPVDPEGFTLALFDSPAEIAVDASGKVLRVEDADFQGLLNLADQIKDLPLTGNFRNTWVIMQPRTSQPIERVLLPVTGKDGRGLRETSVQGYDGVTTRLKTTVGGIQYLPLALQNLIGSVLEAKEALNDDRDESMIKRVKAMLGNVF
ncbi:hypothetical protein Ac2012v2_008198 [Leucoagaricus gongylophorus]